MGLVTERGVGLYAAGQPTETHWIGRHRLHKSGGRAVLWCHSAGGLADEPFLPGNNCLRILQGLVDLGCVIISVDAGGTGHWGNDTAQTRLDSSWQYLQTRYGVRSDRVILCGVSMGGLLCLNWARTNPTKVSALTLFFPAVNLQWMHDNGATAGTETAYGGSLTTFNAAVGSHNPSAHPTDYANIPRKMWHASNDTVVSTAEQVSFATAAAVPAINLGAVGHANMTAVSPPSVTDFVAPLV